MHQWHSLQTHWLILHYSVLYWVWNAASMDYYWEVIIFWQFLSSAIDPFYLKWIDLECCFFVLRIMCFFFCSGLREPHGDSFFSQSNFPKSLFFCCRFVMFQGASRRITSLDPSWHPVVGEPIRTPWIVLFKNLPVIVAFLCFRRVEGKFLSCLLQQEVINLQAQEEEEEKSMLRKTFCTWLNIPLVVSRNIKSVLPFKKQLIYLFIAHLIWLRKQQEKTANIRRYQIFQAWETKRHSGYKPYQLRPTQLTPFPLFPHWCGEYGAPPCASLIATPGTLYKSPFFIRDLKWWIGLHCELHICDLQGSTRTSSRKPNAFSHLKITSPLKSQHTSHARLFIWDQFQLHLPVQLQLCHLTLGYLRRENS